MKVRGEADHSIDLDNFLFLVCYNLLGNKDKISIVRCINRGKIEIVIRNLVSAF